MGQGQTVEKVVAIEELEFGVVAVVVVAGIRSLVEVDIVVAVVAAAEVGIQSLVVVAGRSLVELEQGYCSIGVVVAVEGSC